jgi:large subunit ribosomal protein L31
MKPQIHPAWFSEARVTCACGATFTVGATVAKIDTEVCASCHPFFTGEQRIVDTAGQVDRFMRRLEAGAEQRKVEMERQQSREEAEREAKRQRRGLTPVRARRAATPKPAAKPAPEPKPDAAADAES